MMTLVVIGLFFIGAGLGSFAAAQVWRLRAHQLRTDKAEGYDVPAAEYKHLKPLMNQSISTDASRCLHCQHRLAWYDLLPIISWLRLGGRCRYCHKPIGRFEFYTEVGVGLFVALSFVAWPELVTTLDYTVFILWVSAGVVMAILLGYDVKWMLLPDSMNLLLAGIGVAYVVVSAANGIEVSVWSLLGAIAAISGLYGLLYIISKGKWVGFGDVKLGVGLGLLLGAWQLGLLALFLANLLGVLLVAPALIRRTMSPDSQLPLGPLLIVGTVIAVLYGAQIIDWYLSASLRLFLS